ncbi:MAG: hypothetical protein A2V67_10425 [Deltaproteobacteria bacterium RBG_13_61_14]|nr:MAG: hypothetical protein A2V67_10425 [Deltaproteobacteria bacterium RBG_13_61_14]
MKKAWPMIMLLLVMGDQGHSAAVSDTCDELWAKREERTFAGQAFRCYAEAARANPRSEELWVKTALAGYYLGELIPLKEKEPRLQAFEEGKEAALQAMKVNPQSVGGNFWATVNNGRVTEIKGLLSGTFDFGLCIKAMTEVTRQDYKYYHGGVYRYWGRFVHEIPSLGRRMARFTLEDSIDLYKRSLEVEPNFFMTRLYMAESFLEDGKREEAKKQLEWVVSHSPDLLPEAVPENRLYQRQARELLQKEFGGEDQD